MKNLHNEQCLGAGTKARPSRISTTTAISCGLGMNAIGLLSRLGKLLQPNWSAGKGARERGDTDDKATRRQVSVRSGGRQFEFTADDYKVTSGSMQDGSAVYEFTPNPDNAPETARLCKDGKYHLVGGMSASVVAVGRRDKYEDTTF